MNQAPTPTDEAAQLRAALASRPTIDLAKGVLMAARRCDEQAAFAELARVSMACNIKVALLAQVVLDRVVLPRSGPAPTAEPVPAAARAAVDRWLGSLPVR